MSDLAVLDIFLHEQLIGTISHLPGDQNLFAFNENYISDQLRSTLSLSFKDVHGGLISPIKSTQTKVPPFFSNLLPEGPLREYLAAQAKVSPEREFYLLAALGKDLPGALRVHSATYRGAPLMRSDDMNKVLRLESKAALHFSLAGVQLKFSAIWEHGKRLTIPVDGAGGAWIVKLPSAQYANVPENEFAMMSLAKRLGIDVPEIALVPIDQISGLPEGMARIGNKAFIIKRFDRAASGEKIHIEDFAQVFGVFPDKKYRAASYRTIAEVIWAETGEKGLAEFIRRFVFNALIGNGDMHLKNWSLIYPDKRKAQIAPAYDFVSTIPYLPGDELALNFVDSKAFQSLTHEQFKRFAAKAKLPEHLVLNTLQETVEKFKEAWPSIEEFDLAENTSRIISKHLETLPFY